MPSNRREVSNKNGGMTDITALLTTYIPPQMDAALRPAKSPNAGDLLIRIHRCEQISFHERLADESPQQLKRRRV